MHPDDKHKIISRYDGRTEQFGHGPAAIGEPKERQAFYYHFMLAADGFQPSDSILDVGCGYGYLLRYLRSTGWRGRYCGLDINPRLVEEGRRRTPDADLRVHDIQEAALGEEFDWCFSCHVITSDTDEVPYLEHLRGMLDQMWTHCRKGILFNLLSPLADYTHPVHTRPIFTDVLGIANRLTNRFALRHDYMPFEFAMQLYKRNDIDRELLIFSEHDALFRRIAADWKKSDGA